MTSTKRDDGYGPRRGIFAVEHRYPAWVVPVWCMLAAFGAYASMYGFRKPFTAGTYQDMGSGTTLKTLLITSQVLGYTLSKFVGIKVIAEMPSQRRLPTLLGLIVFAEMALLGFALAPVPWKPVCLFLNGLPLGLVFGLVLGFLEGRRLTELFVAGLCASFVVADGLTKSVGAWLLGHGITEAWMPFAAGAIFLGPLLFFTWMLYQIPPPTEGDVSSRAERVPISRVERRAILVRYGMGLFLIILPYVLITILRSIRADFAPEIWSGMGIQQQPSLFTRSELWVALGILVLNGLFVVVDNNRHGLLAGLAMSFFSLVMVVATLYAYRQAYLAPYPFMIVLGLGLYLPYVAVHTTIFERLIAVTRLRGNIGFLMYLADAVGYLGYSLVMLGRGYLPKTGNFLEFFMTMAGWLAGISALSFLGAILFFSRSLFAGEADHAQ